MDRVSRAFKFNTNKYRKDVLTFPKMYENYFTILLFNVPERVRSSIRLCKHIFEVCCRLSSSAESLTTPRYIVKITNS